MTPVEIAPSNPNQRQGGTPMARTQTDSGFRFTVFA